MIIYDADGNERDAAWLRATYGNVQVQVKAGATYHVSELHERYADSTLVVTLQDGYAPVPETAVAFYWPDAPVDNGAGYYNRCVRGVTNVNGDVGFGMGGGAYYYPPAGGPHAVWVYGGDSDLVTGLGMLGGTNHNHLNVVFGKGEPEPPAVTYTVSVAVIGQGVVEPMGGVYKENAVATLRATPAAGWRFAGWTGDMTATTSVLMFSVTRDASLTATFEQIPPEPEKLTVFEQGVWDRLDTIIHLLSSV